MYNTAVVHVNETVVRNVYVDRTVINNTTVVNHNSFNGPGGITARPTVDERAAMHEQHFARTTNQVSHEQMARSDRNQWASNNHGTPGTPAMDSVNGRRYDQQGRIAQGIGSGQMTPHETANVESREAHLNGEIHNDRAANGGTLTPAERNKVNNQQNNLSRSIYDDKHNAATDKYGNTEVGARRDNQQQRIANGVASGQMTPAETARTEHQESHINHQWWRLIGMPTAAKLTPAEKARSPSTKNRIPQARRSTRISTTTRRLRSNGEFSSFRCAGHGCEVKGGLSAALFVFWQRHWPPLQVS